MPENILEACRYDGKDYSVPISVNSYSMFYNTELFEKEGLTYPKTEDEFWTLCDTLKSRGIPQSPLEIRISACSRDILHVCLQEQLPMMQKRSQRL